MTAFHNKSHVTEAAIAQGISLACHFVNLPNFGREESKMNRNVFNQIGAIVAGLIFCFSFGELWQGKAYATAKPVVSESLEPHSARHNQQPAVDSRLIAANTRFSFKLFSEILKQEKDKNVFISPASVATALAMTYNGAEGRTQQAMANALELQGMSLEAVNRGNAALKASLKNPDPKVQLVIANSLWAKQGIPFKPTFLQRNQEFYQAKVTHLDFSAPSALRRINTWVNQNTQGKIKQIIDQIDSNAVLFLLNAVYFKGRWTQAFDKSKTVEGPFHLLNGRQKLHPMMSQTGEYQYYEDGQFQAVSLPYGDGRLSLYIFLPREDSSLAAFYQQLNAENWQRWMAQFSQREVFIQLPRFKVEYEVKLKEMLKALGMAEAFDSSQANFSGISCESTFINQVLHKTFVEVNEEGTEAAAVTSVEMSGVSATPQMIVDRPFFSVIRDNQTGTVLFMGSITEPH